MEHGNLCGVPTLAGNLSREFVANTRKIEIALPVRQAKLA
jgi:hypothetical protein